MPYLSIVVASRNDDHGIGIHVRTQSFLDSLAEQCHRHKLSAELIIVEWNPPQERPPLRTVFAPPPASEYFMVRFITVPPELHNTLTHSNIFTIFQMIAKNVGIRRAKGEFILATNVDIIFSEELMAFFAAKKLQSGFHYRIDRHDLGAFTLPPHLYGEELMQFCRENVIRVQGRWGTYEYGNVAPTGTADRLHTNACGDFALMSRADWEAVRGYPELETFSIYIDGLGLHTSEALGISQYLLEDPMHIYHIEHHSGWVLDKPKWEERPHLDYHTEYVPFCRKLRATGKPLAINKETWGYSDMHLAESTFVTPEQKNSVFQHWQELISYADQRLYYRDQSLQSFQSLHALAQRFRPTVIVELGTLSGMSLRTWIAAAPQARIHAVDLSFTPLRKSIGLIPCDLSQVNLIEANILRVEFAALWNNDDRVLFFVDAHDLPTVPIMPHVLRNALSYLPEGSLVVVDDIWHSPEKVDSGNARRLFETHVLHEIDELLLFEPHYAPYHGGGSFFGFLEVKPLLRYVNKHGIELHFEPGNKHVSFYSRRQPPVLEAFDEKFFAAQCGSCQYHPLENVDTQFPLGQKILKKIRECYVKGDMKEALSLALDFRDAHPDAPGMHYAIAVLLLRLHEFRHAKQFLELEAVRQDAHPNTERLYNDLNKMFFLLHAPVKKMRKPGLTMFAAPKAFTGEISTIQKNAITSWMLLTPQPEIILFGDDEGIAEAAAELGVRHIEAIRKNECNTPLVHALFQQAQEESETELLAYINADIILFSSFTQGVLRAAKAFESFLLVGGRWDYDQVGPVDFSEPDWEEKLQHRVFRQGKPHALTGMDYFVFRAHKAWPRIPPFALGRFAWDTWLLHDAVSQGLAVIDATAFLPVAHQNHAYAHYSGGFGAMRQGVEGTRNLRLAGKITAESALDAPYYFDAQGEIHKRSDTPGTVGIVKSLIRINNHRHGPISK